MKDWHVLLSDLTEEQEAHLVYLCNKFRLKEHSSTACKEKCDTNIGLYDQSLNYWLGTSGKQISYKKAVKKLNKLLEQQKCKKLIFIPKVIFLVAFIFVLGTCVWIWEGLTK